MLVTRTPFRISFVGGGSDISSYYTKQNGAVISTSVDKYIYISVHKKFDKGFRLAYSKIEEVSNISNIKHPIVKNVLKLLNVKDQLEISSIADIPGHGTGLGSSSSYCVGLLKALTKMNDMKYSKEKLAELACKVEIEMCKEPIGKQDQYAAALGGYNKLIFKKDGCVSRNKIKFGNDFKNYFESHWIVIYTGITRSTKTILKDQDNQIKNYEKFNTMNEMVSLVEPFEKAIHSESIEDLSKVLKYSWTLKKSLSKNISNNFIDDMYDLALSNGALSGKILGAGAGGFLFLLAHPSKHKKIKEKFKEYRIINFSSENSGTTVIYNM